MSSIFSRISKRGDFTNGTALGDVLYAVLSLMTYSVAVQRARVHLVRLTLMQMSKRAKQ